MAACYWCYWGWPKPIRDIYDAAVKKLEGNDGPMLYGPAHIVWADENWDSADWCLHHFDDYSENLDCIECAVVRESLEQLRDVPSEYKSEPSEYDDENPKDFPPPKRWLCERR